MAERRQCESDSEINDNEQSVSKANPKAKKLRVYQKFRNEYTEKFPCIVPSKQGKDFARCTFCDRDFKISQRPIRL